MCKKAQASESLYGSAVHCGIENAAMHSTLI